MQDDRGTLYNISQNREKSNKMRESRRKLSRRTVLKSKSVAFSAQTAEESVKKSRGDRGEGG
jgi:hypothetical protein